MADWVEPGNGHRQAAARRSLAKEDTHGSLHTRWSISYRADVSVYFGELSQLIRVTAGEDNNRSTAP
jgi:hypothetical protein